MSEVDPLSSYDYPYSAFGQINTNNEYTYNVKHEPLGNTLNQVRNVDAPVNTEYNKNSAVNNDLNNRAEENIPEIIDKDTKDDIKPIVTENTVKRERKRKGKTSNYWNKKVTDANFPFYGCTICNVSFTSSQELDQHVTIHKGRLTSYDIRIRNQLKRKKLRKEQKKLKKGKKIKTENLDIEIKPEDGYIGNEKATEYQDGEQVNDIENKIVTNSGDSTDKPKKLMKDDPRLQKLFKCFACQKQFSLSYYLKLHVRSHTGMLQKNK